MENKNIIIIAVVVVIIAILGVIFATGILNGGEKTAGVTTPFKTEFMEGTFAGNVSLENDSEKFMHSYEDKENKITYNISTVDDSDALMDIYYIQGVMNPEKRSFNGNDWNIYFTQAVQGNDSNSSDKPMNIIICQSQGEKQGYLIYMIIDAKSKVNATLNTYGESYTGFVEPLLKSITLKESKNVPKIYEEFGLTKDQFNQQMDLVKQYKAGNTSVLQQQQEAAAE
jgi:Tfp pilus assembly protein PilE